MVLMEKKNKIFLLNLFIVTIIFLIDRLSKLYVINLYEDISNQQIFLTSFLNVYLILFLLQCFCIHLICTPRR